MPTKRSKSRSKPRRQKAAEKPAWKPLQTATKPRAIHFQRIWNAYRQAEHDSLGDIAATIDRMMARLTDASVSDATFFAECDEAERQIREHATKYVTVDRADLQLLADGAAQVSEGLTCLLSEEAAK